MPRSQPSSSTYSKRNRSVVDQGRPRSKRCQAASFDNVSVYSRDPNATRLIGQERVIEDFSVDLLFDVGRFTVGEAGLVQGKVHQKRMPSAHRILALLRRRPTISHLTQQH